MLKRAFLRKCPFTLIRSALILSFALIFFTSCKTLPLVSTETKSETESSVSKDILLSREQKLLERLDRLEKSIMSENVTVTTVTTEYDTEKPINPDTGKPPVKSETKTDITKNKQGETITSDKSTKSDENITSLKDNSTVASKNNQVEKVKQESPKDPYRYRYIFYSIVAVIIIMGIGIFFAVKNKWFSFLAKLF